MQLETENAQLKEEVVELRQKVAELSDTHEITKVLEDTPPSPPPVSEDRQVPVELLVETSETPQASPSPELLDQLEVVREERQRVERRFMELMAEPGPVLVGNFYEHTRKCGKLTCKCAHGEPHRTYYRNVPLPEGKKKVRVPKHQVEAVRAATEKNQELGRLISTLTKLNQKEVFLISETRKALQLKTL